MFSTKDIPLAYLLKFSEDLYASGPRARVAIQNLLDGKVVESDLQGVLVLQRLFAGQNRQLDELLVKCLEAYENL